MKHTLEFETIINCTTEELFRFHADTKNLPLITPPGTTVHIIKLEKELKEGNTASLKIQKGLLSFILEFMFAFWNFEYSGCMVY
jgi:ligand-binding SRPBCC domain-containing protein